LECEVKPGPPYQGEVRRRQANRERREAEPRQCRVEQDKSQRTYRG